MKNYFPELSDHVMYALNVDFLMQIVSFVQDLVKTIHDNDPPSQPAKPVPGTYDQKVVLPTSSRKMVAGCVIFRHTH